MSISNIGVYGIEVRRLTDPLIGASRAHLSWPPSPIRHRCVMSEVSLWARTQAPQSQAVTCSSEETK